MSLGCGGVGVTLLRDASYGWSVGRFGARTGRSPVPVPFALSQRADRRSQVSCKSAGGVAKTCPGFLAALNSGTMIRWLVGTVGRGRESKAFPGLPGAALERRHLPAPTARRSVVARRLELAGVLLGTALCAAGLFSGCGGDDDDDPLDSVNGFCVEWAKRACSEPVQLNCSSGSPEKCRNAQSNYCLELVPADHYTRAGADKCLAAVQAAYRDGDLDGDELAVVTELAGDCRGILTGDGEEGDTCMGDIDCDIAAGLSCIKRLDEPSGECHVPVPVEGGDDCDDPELVCPSNAYCTEDRFCRSRQDKGEVCSRTEPCKRGLNCQEPEDGGVGVCVDKLGAGDACRLASDCESGICRQGTSGRICARLIRLDIDQPICDEFR